MKKELNSQALRESRYFIQTLSCCMGEKETATCGGAEWRQRLVLRHTRQFQTSYRNTSDKNIDFPPNQNLTRYNEQNCKYFIFYITKYVLKLFEI